eukprot:scaffold10016_cov54-Attheya_sp.AAC.8
MTWLVDLLVANRLGSDLPETYAQGRKIIDHVFGTATLLTLVKRAGYLAYYNDGILSDHHGIFLDLDRNICFGKQQEPLEERVPIKLTTSNIQGARQYREHANKTIVSNHIFK